MEVGLGGKLVGVKHRGRNDGTDRTRLLAATDGEPGDLDGIGVADAVKHATGAGQIQQSANRI
jgi:hypothetical protein